MINITDFTGGYNDSEFHLDIKDNEFSQFSNVDIMKNGGFKVRNGTKKVNTEAFSGKVTQVIDWRLKDGTTKTVVVADKKMYVLSSVFGDYKCVKFNNEELTLNRDTVAYMFFKDDFYFTDGNTMYKWSDSVNYLHNLSMTEPYSFKKGDVIKITASEKETGFSGANLSDVRQPFVKTLRYAIFYTDDREAGTKDYDYTEYSIRASMYNDEDKGLYSLKTKTVEYTSESSSKFVETYIEIDEYDPSYITISLGEKTQILPTYKLSSGIDDVKTFDIKVQYKQISTQGYVINDKFTKVKLYPEYIKKATVNDYYIFGSDCDNFYPHNYGYESNKAFYGSTANLKKIESTDDLEFNIQTVEVPFDIKSCEYFAYHPQSFRFFAGGNRYDPCAVYYSNLNDFETWETAGDEETIVNVLYPRYNYGGVTGLISTGNNLVIAYKNGFSSVLGTNPDEYIFYNLSVPLGVTSPNSVCIIPNGLMFYSNGGIYIMSNSLISTDYVKMPSQSEFADISENKCKNILKDSQNHKGVYFNNKYYLYFTDKDSSAKILVYDFSPNSFLLYENIELSCMIVKENNYLYGGSGKYVLNLFSNGVNSDFKEGSDVAIKFKVKSKLFDFSQSYLKFKLEKVYLTTNYLDGSEDTNVFIALKNEYEETKADKSIEGGELWKNSLQNSLWTSNDEYVTFCFDVNILFHRLGILIDNEEKGSYKKPFCVYGISLEFSQCQKNLPMYKNDVRKINKDINLNYERR